MTTTLQERLSQARKLVDMFSAKQVAWRFDPVVFWKEDDLSRNNLGDFDLISKRISEAGIRRCIISFAQWYGKCVKRAARRNFRHYDPNLEDTRKAVDRIVTVNEKNGIETFSCSCPALLAANGRIKKSRCVDPDLLSSIFGGEVPGKKDPGQREECGCAISKDIGKYDQKCRHGCVYCYANPSIN